MLDAGVFPCEDDAISVCTASNAATSQTPQALSLQNHLLLMLPHALAGDSALVYLFENMWNMICVRSLLGAGIA